MSLSQYFLFFVKPFYKFSITFTHTLIEENGILVYVVLLILNVICFKNHSDIFCFHKYISEKLNSCFLIYFTTIMNVFFICFWVYRLLKQLLYYHKWWTVTHLLMPKANNLISHTLVFVIFSQNDIWVQTMSSILHHLALPRVYFYWKQVSWTQALRTIVKNCYKQHGREDLLYAFEDQVTTQVATTATHSIAHLVPSQTVVQTISNPDGTVSLIQVSSGPSTGNNCTLVVHYTVQ